jgi:hypothetical protein
MMGSFGMNGEVCHELHGGRGARCLDGERAIQFSGGGTLKRMREPTL